MTDPQPTPAGVTRVAVAGVPGRMGTRLVQLVLDDARFALGSALGRPGSPRLGLDTGPLVGRPEMGVCLVDSGMPEALAEVDAVIDFSAPETVRTLAPLCARLGRPLVVGTTGLTPEDHQWLDDAAQSIPVLWAPNTNRAVHLLFRLVAEAATALQGQADVEIIERHHNRKQDAPSGTALRLAQVVAEALALELDNDPDDSSSALVHGRRGRTGPRPRDQIGIHALRCGDNPGEHTVVFGLDGDVLELTHRATNRDGFARGALEAARGLVGRSAGRYTMADLLESASKLT